MIGFFEINAANRTLKVLVAAYSFDIETMLSADHSAAMRIVPIIVVAQKIGLYGFDDWFGYGIDFTGTFLSNEVPGVVEGTTGGGLLQIWIEYGFISFILFTIFSISNTF